MTAHPPGEIPSRPDSSETLDPMAAELRIAEYTALRGEILEHIQRDGQILALTVLALGTLLAAGVQFRNAALILIYPIVATALALMWVAEDQQIAEIGDYIYANIEDKLSTQDHPFWEHYVDSKPQLRRRSRYSLFLFYFTSQLVSLIIASSISSDIWPTILSLSAGHVGFASLSPDIILFALASLAVVISLLRLVSHIIYIKRGP